MIELKGYQIGLGKPLTIIAGPCVVENEKMIIHTAARLKKETSDLPVQFIFKSSYKKANRTSLSGFSGLDFVEALHILRRAKEELEVILLTDVHNQLEVPIVAEVADVLQIPAFLCRQTDLLVAAGRTGRVVNIKKGQFLAPEDMGKAAEKVRSTGNSRILLTERGTFFGYRNLVVDMRNLLIMAKLGYPVVYDATHSVQIPGGLGNASGGQPEFILPLARAALATGMVSAVFMEVHPDPPHALSDAASQLPLNRFREVIEDLLEIYQMVMNK
ncbi:MAG: 3-deoxy-8-phosphooctulonate synthase [Calditrichia bacterium]